MNILALLALVGPALLGSPDFYENGSSQLPKTPKKGDEVAVMETGEGRIVLMFYPEKAPKHVEHFKSLAKKKFYDGTRFHRTMPNFMIQGGDPNSKDLKKASAWGAGGYIDEKGKRVSIKAEFNDIKHTRGILSMARSTDPNSASSQFFIVHKDARGLDQPGNRYSAFGRVVKGIEVVDKIVNKPSGRNGSVTPSKAVILESLRIVTWPIKE